MVSLGTLESGHTHTKKKISILKYYLANKIKTLCVPGDHVTLQQFNTGCLEKVVIETSARNGGLIYPEGKRNGLAEFLRFLTISIFNEFYVHRFFLLNDRCNNMPSSAVNSRYKHNRITVQPDILS